MSAFRVPRLTLLRTTLPRLRLALCALAVAATALVTAPTAPAAQTPAPVQVTFQGTTFRIPREYVVALFRGDQGAVDMNLVAETFEPYTAKVDPDFPRNFLRIGLRIFLRSYGPGRTGADEIRPWIGRWAELATEPAEDLDADAAAAYGVPRDLRFRRSLPPAEGPSRGSQDDRFLPTVPRHDASGAAIPEAIFCMSPFDAAVRHDPSRLNWLRCQYRFPYRGFEVQLSFERHLLPRWQELRDRAVALLENFAAP